MNITYLNASETYKRKVQAFEDEWNNSNTFICSKTSGSTGQPKEIQIPKQKMIDSARMTGQFLSIQKGENALHCLSIDTIAGKMMFIRALILKLNLFIVEPCSNPLKFVFNRIDFIALVPLQLASILQSDKEKLNQISNSIIGGGEISKTIELELYKNKLTVYQTFGMTETISHIAMRKIGFEQQEAYTTLGENFITEENSRLVIHSPLLNFIPLKTNDSIELIDAKTFIWKGRTDFVINTGGVKIHPEEVEKKINSIISTPFFISSLKDPFFGEKLILCIESKLELHYPIKSFSERLHKFEIPKEIYFFPTFTYTESQKINRLQTLKLIAHAIQQVL
ncbi:MAG: AMP-binding protein [Flavobacteriia bacterium]|nr:AMP-binding protein [Flavobacteriia bacterium]